MPLGGGKKPFWISKKRITSTMGKSSGSGEKKGGELFMTASRNVMRCVTRSLNEKRKKG